MAKPPESEYGTAPQDGRMVDVLPGGAVSEFPPREQIKPSIRVIQGEPSIVKSVLRAERRWDDANRTFRSEK